MDKVSRNAANFRATLTIMVISIAITRMIKKYTK